MNNIISFVCEVTEVSVKQKNVDTVTKVVLSVPESDSSEAQKLTEFINTEPVIVVVQPSPKK